MENTIKQITTPQEAIAQFVGDQFMDWLMEYLEHEVHSWESLKTIASSSPKPEKIKKFILQRYLALEAYAAGRDGEPGLIGFAIANLSESSDPVAENALELLQKLPDQETITQVWSKLFTAVGLTDEEIKRAEPKELTRNYITELSDVYSNSEWQSTMAAYTTFVKLNSIEANSIIAMLKNNLQISDSVLEVLGGDLKIAAKPSIEASHILERAAVDQEGKDLIFQGLQRQLETHREFCDGLSKYLLE